MDPTRREHFTSDAVSGAADDSATVQPHVVDDRVFLLGLDELYRDAMKRHERTELLLAARRVAAALHVGPANVPVEGYYARDEELTEYFRLVRALREVDASRGDAVARLPEFRRLRDVTSAPIYGRPHHDGKLLPHGRDALSQALLDTRPRWTIEGLTAAARACALAADDISLVGLAARTGDAVALAAVRESVVLYATSERLCARPKRPEYLWQVDRDLAEQAGRFIDVFNALFDEQLPPPDPDQAARYWHAFKDNEIFGRCVRLGSDDTVSPERHYHWAIRHTRGEGIGVQEFWDSEVWATERYRSALLGRERVPEPTP